MAHFLIKEQHYLFLGYTMAFVRRPENILLLYTYFIREVSLYGWTTPVLLAKIHLFDYVKIIDRFTCLVKSKPVKQEVSCTESMGFEPIWASGIYHFILLIIITYVTAIEYLTR